MNGHCYADRDQFWTYLADAGADEHRGDDQLLLGFLQAASRSVDEYCRRTGRDHPISGFGPRVGINYYDAEGGSTLDLNDDLLTLTSFEVASSTGGSYAVWTNGVDFLLRPYGRSPYREVIALDRSLGSGLKVVRATATWGFGDERGALAATVATGGWTDTATTLTFSDTSELALGQTLWCQTEALYVTGLAGLTATVVRGAHGTTAAAHTQGTALSRQTYDANVVLASLQLALRRWRHRELGLAGDYGGMGGVPQVSERAKENDILRSIIGHLAFAGRT